MHPDDCSRLKCDLLSCSKFQYTEAIKEEIEKRESHAVLARTNTAWRLELERLEQELELEDDDGDDENDDSNDYVQVDADLFDYNMRLISSRYD